MSEHPLTVHVFIHAVLADTSTKDCGVFNLDGSTTVKQFLSQLAEREGFDPAELNLTPIVNGKACDGYAPEQTLASLGVEHNSKLGVRLTLVR